MHRRILSGTAALLFAALGSAQGEVWQEIEVPETDRPGARGAGAMAYFPPVQELLLFGGGSGNADEKVLPDNLATGTWTFANDQWRPRQFEFEPQLRAGHAMVYDPSRQVIVLFGGMVEDPAAPTPILLADTWEYDGAGWNERSPATIPPARGGHAMAYDHVRGKVVLFGGSDRLNLAGGVGLVAQSDMWEWDGVDWQEIDLSGGGPVPGPRGFARMASSEQRGEILMSGGFGPRLLPAPAPGQNPIVNILDEVWRWDGSSWSVVSEPTEGPNDDEFLMRVHHGWVYDDLRDVYVAFGGRDISNPNRSPVMQQYLPGNDEWVNFPNPAGDDTVRQPGRWVQATYDPIGARMVEFGGERLVMPADDNETWVFFGPAVGVFNTIDEAFPGQTSGCASSGGTIPRLAPAQSGSLQDRPVASTDFTVEVTDLPNDLSVALTWGFSDTLWTDTFLSLPISLDFIGMGGCWLVTDPARFRTMPNVGGTASARFFIPDEESLIGLQFYMQALVVDPDIAGTGGNSIGIVLTNGLRGRIGSQ